MTKDEIKKEWDAFIEYPEGSGKLYVTTTSALLFVFPASAGMNRKLAGFPCRTCSIPRIRGDEPVRAAAEQARQQYSPHPRG